MTALTGTVRYFDVDHRGYEQPREVQGEILADSPKFVTVETESTTYLIPIDNTIHIAIPREAR